MDGKRWLDLIKLHMSDDIYLILQLLDYFLTIISLERSMWEGPKNNYMTLGPNFYLFSVLSPRICFCFVNPYFLAGIAAFCEILLLAVSKHVLKRLKKAGFFSPYRLFGPDLLFSWTFAPGGRLSYEAYYVEVPKYHKFRCSLTL